MKHVRYSLMVLLLSLMPVGAEETNITAPPTNAPPETAMLVFQGQKLFEMISISAVPLEQDLATMNRRLKRLAHSPLVHTDSLFVHDDPDMNVSLIFAGDRFVFAVWEKEAAYHGVPRMQLADERKTIIAEALEKYRRSYGARSLIKGAVFALIASAILWILVHLIIRLRRKEIKFIEKHLEGRKLFGLLEGESLTAFNGVVTKVVQILLFVWLFAGYLNFVLSFFPWTFNVSATLFSWITTPLFLFWRGFVGKLPDFVALAIIIVITRFVLKGFRYLFNQLGDGKLKITGFYMDWADPTYKLIRCGIVAFALVAAWPYIPGSGSPAFKGISIFVGVLFSFGSTSVMGNIFSGLVITYMRPFVPGDFVEINEMLGTVLDRRTFSMRIRTTKNEVVNIPNSAVTANHIINHSRRVKKDGVLLYTAVTIGYDVPAERVESLLLDTVKEIDGVLESPEPFVLVTSLDDFYVTYELNAATRTPERRPRIYSDLHKQILTNFAEAGVEIMSPHYRHNRTGNESTVSSPGRTAGDEQP